MKQKKQLRILFIVIVFLLASCSQNDTKSSDSQVLQTQVSALQTQNALLQAGQTVDNPNQNATQEIEVPSPPIADTPLPAATIEPTLETLPTEPVPAGQPIAYDGWSIMVSKEIALRYDEFDNWGIDIIVRNLGDSARVFRFTNAAISIKDNSGNVFEPCTIQCKLHGGTSCEEYFHEVKNLNIEGNGRVIVSSDADYTSAGCMKEDGIGMFMGPIPMASKQLIVHLEDFGPFTGVDVFIDL